MKPHNRVAAIIAIGGFVSNAAVGAFINRSGALYLLAFALIISLPYLILALSARKILSTARDVQDETRKAESAFTAILGASLPFLLLRWSGHSVADALGSLLMELTFVVCTPLTIFLGRKTEPIATSLSLRCFGSTTDQEPRPLPTFIAMFLMNSVALSVVQFAIFSIAVWLFFAI